jgi:hypothetical protein
MTAVVSKHNDVRVFLLAQQVALSFNRFPAFDSLVRRIFSAPGPACGSLPCRTFQTSARPPRPSGLSSCHAPTSCPLLLAAENNVSDLVEKTDLFAAVLASCPTEICPIDDDASGTSRLS